MMKLYMQYIGALTLMGELVRYSSLSLADRTRMDEAYMDANAVLKKTGSTSRFRRSSSGWAMFEEGER